MTDMLPEWFTDLTVGEIIFFWAGVLLIIAAIVKLWKPVSKVFKGLDTIVGDWNGKEERRDPITGTLLDPAVPGVVAQIKILRDQLQNSHQDTEYPNLRDDLDTKATKEDVSAVADAVSALAGKVDEHISIAKASDDRQDATEATLTKYLPILKQLAGEE